MEPITLGPDENPPEHPCASSGFYQTDIALLNYLLQDLRVLTRRAAKGETDLHPHQVITWEVHGLARRTVICDPDSLMQPKLVHMVGFFGNRRANSDLEMIEIEEVGLIDEFRGYPGILSYSSVELVDGYWANLVVHSSRDDREIWRGSQIHAHAAERVAPEIYTGVRIHNGYIDGGPVGTETVVIESTKYWDYEVSPTWHAIRPLPGGAHESIEQPASS